MTRRNWLMMAMELYFGHDAWINLVNDMSCIISFFMSANCPVGTI